MSVVKKQPNKKHIMFRYSLISLGLLIMAATVTCKLFQTTVVEAAAWNKMAQEELSKSNVIPPERGNILACNGSILACNITLYNIFIDMRHRRIPTAEKVNWASVDSLADSLDVYYPRIEGLFEQPTDTFNKYTWHKRLRDHFSLPVDERSGAFRLARNRTMDDYKRILNFPFLKQFAHLKGYRCPLYKDGRNRRLYPFGKMAYRSIGRVNEQRESGEIHGYSGLEKDLDTLLYGKAGRSKRVAMNAGIDDWVDVPAERGYDILTTIDIDMQEMVEEELLKVCETAGAEWGTAILMEVKSGEIKAISNIELLDDGTYGEALNRAVMPYEPGSVMKPISMMIAFEDGLVKSLNDMIDCSPFQATSDPHAPTVKNMKQVIEMSSNTGIARIIFRGYSQNPETFHDRLSSIGFFEKMNSGIADEEIPRIKKLVDKDSRGNRITMTARHLDLARQAFGYVTEIPPLYTLSYYNAIANGGRYVRPHLVRALRRENMADSILPISYIRDRICSEETAAKVRECIREVVWGKHGTARAVQDDRVEIAGKTGTVIPHIPHRGYDKSKRRFAFASFFPYESPKYSCMVLISSSSGQSANRTSGQVVKNIAVKMFARGLLENPAPEIQKTTESRPTFVASRRCNPRKVSSELGIRNGRKFKEPSQTHGNTVPDVCGYELATAVDMLENKGLNVKVTGAGRVVWQSLTAGTPAKRGQTITLKLKI